MNGNTPRGRKHRGQKHGMSARHSKETRICKKTKRYARCLVPTSKCDNCDEQEQVRRGQRTHSPRSFMTQHPIHTHALIGCQRRTTGSENNRDTATHTQTRLGRPTLGDTAAAT